METGITNGMLTEIVSGISEGTEVLVDFNIENPAEEASDQKATNPFMPRPRNRNNNSNQKK